MRLNNFSIILGASAKIVLDTTATLPTPFLVVSGASGGVLSGKRGGSNRFWGFMSPIGDDSSENPYGNTSVYNVGKVNTSTSLELSQSLSAPITGSASASFLFITEKDYRG